MFSVVSSILWTGCEDLSADLVGVHVVVHEGVNDCGQLGLDYEVTGVLKVRNQLTQSLANLKQIQKYWIFKLVKLTSLMVSTISCSVVSLVIKSSRSCMMSMQILQVRSFLGRTRAEAAKTREARTRRTLYK